MEAPQIDPREIQKILADQREYVTSLQQEMDGVHRLRKLLVFTRHLQRTRSPFQDLPMGLGRRSEKPVRVCIVSSEFIGPWRNGGIGTAYTTIGEVLAEAGHPVTFLYTGGDYCQSETIEHWVDHYARKGIRLVPLDDTAARRVKGYPYLVKAYLVYRWLRANAFDIVHFPEMGGLGYYALLARRQNIAFRNTLLCVGTHSPTLWIKEANSSFFDRIWDLQLDFIERSSVALADVVWSPSRYMLQWMEKYAWAMPDLTYRQQYILPRSARMPALNAGPGANGGRARIREFVFFGRLETRKGITLFCDALDRLAREGKAGGENAEPIQVTFLGKHDIVLGVPSKDYIETRAEGWPFDWKIIDNFDQPHAIDYLRQPGRLAIMASPVDNSPNTVYECLGAHIPFIAARSGGIPELIAEADIESNTFPWRAEDLAVKLATAIKDGIPTASPSVEPSVNEKRWVQWHEEAVGKPWRKVAKKGAPSTGKRPGVSVCLWTEGPEPADFLPAMMSLMRQDRQDFELVVLCRDAEARALRRGVEKRLAGRSMKTLDSRLRFAHPGNLGLAADLNTLASAAEGDRLLFMSGRTMAREDAISKLLAASENFGADVLTLPVAVFPASSGGAASASPQWAILPIGGALPRGYNQDALKGMNLFVRRDFFVGSGGFASSAEAERDDWIFLCRAAAASARFEAMPDPLFLEVPVGEHEAEKYIPHLACLHLPETDDPAMDGSGFDNTEEERPGDPDGSREPAFPGNVPGEEVAPEAMRSHRAPEFFQPESAVTPPGMTSYAIGTGAFGSAGAYGFSGPREPADVPDRGFRSPGDLWIQEPSRVSDAPFDAPEATRSRDQAESLRDLTAQLHDTAPFDMRTSLDSLGRLLEARRTEEALSLFDSMSREARKSTDFELCVQVLLEAAGVFLKSRNKPLALTALEEARNVATRQGNPAIVAQIGKLVEKLTSL